MAENAVITTEPLVDYVSAKMKDQPVEVISLEKVIKNLKKHTEEKLYLPYNGHWNKNGQPQIQLVSATLTVVSRVNCDNLVVFLIDKSKRSMHE